MGESCKRDTNHKMWKTTEGCYRNGLRSKTGGSGRFSTHFSTIKSGVFMDELTPYLGVGEKTGTMDGGMMAAGGLSLRWTAVVVCHLIGRNAAMHSWRDITMTSSP